MLSPPHSHPVPPHFFIFFDYACWARCVQIKIFVHGMTADSVSLAGSTPLRDSTHSACPHSLHNLAGGVLTLVPPPPDLPLRQFQELFPFTSAPSMVPFSFYCHHLFQLRFASALGPLLVWQTGLVFSRRIRRRVRVAPGPIFPPSPPPSTLRCRGWPGVFPSSREVWGEETGGMGTKQDCYGSASVSHEAWICLLSLSFCACFFLKPKTDTGI